MIVIEMDVKWRSCARRKRAVGGDEDEEGRRGKREGSAGNKYSNSLGCQLATAGELAAVGSCTAKSEEKSL